MLLQVLDFLLKDLDVDAPKASVLGPDSDGLFFLVPGSAYYQNWIGRVGSGSVFL